jgi:ribosome-binding protein aMBF1 (putative translation factor)
MNNCAFCQKKILLKFIMSVYNLRAIDIAREINISDSLVRKHISGDRECPPVDAYIVERVFGFKLRGCNIDG